MVVAAFTALVAQIEYRTADGTTCCRYPSRWKVFTAKALIVMTATVGMTVLVLVFTWFGTSLGGVVSGHSPTGAFP